ncbi:MAG TPA: glycosyltransferase family 39 protein [Roseiarcus sp.]
MTPPGGAASGEAETLDGPLARGVAADPDPGCRSRPATGGDTGLGSVRSAQDEAAALHVANRRAAIIVLAFLAARLAFAFALGFGVDEAYTLPISRELRLSYFDHPPLHQWIAHFAARLCGEALGARLPFVALFAATGWLLYRLTSELFGPRAGLIALFALNVTPFFFASPGTWIVPDGPLLFGLALAALALARLFFEPAGDDRRVWRLWLLVGLGFGLAGLSKYIGALAPLGLLAFLAISPSERRWFRHPAPYVAAILAGLIVLPVFVWNAQHGWASFIFQSSRGIASGGLKPLGVPRIALGQIAFLSPWLFIPLVAGIVSGLRGWRDGRRLFLLCLSLPPIALFTAAPLWIEKGQPHWAMAGWFFAFPLMGAWAQDISVPVRSVRRYAILSVALLAALTVGAVLEARAGWLWRLLPAGTTDPTLEVVDWNGLVNAPLLQPSPSFVISTRWREAGKIALALGPSVPIFVVSDDPRGWAYVKGGAELVGRDGVLIARPRDLAAARAALAPLFASLGEAEPFTLSRNGAPAIELMLVSAKGLTQAPPQASQTRPE